MRTRNLTVLDIKSDYIIHIDENYNPHSTVQFEWLYYTYWWELEPSQYCTVRLIVLYMLMRTITLTVLYTKDDYKIKDDENYNPHTTLP